MSKKKTFSSVNIETKDLDRLKEIAEKERRSMGQQISHWIDQHFDSKPQKETA